MSLYRRGGVWWYRFRFCGSEIRESSKSNSKTVAADAERARRRKLEESFNKIQKRAIPPNFQKAADTWLDSRKAKVSAGTVVKYGAALTHLKKFFSGMLICDVAGRNIAAYQQARLKEKAAAATINGEVICLGSILRSCGLWHTIQKDVGLLEEPESGGRALETEEETRLLTATANTGRKQGHWSPIYTVTVLALNTGMRHSEVRRLRWSQVDLTARVLVVGKSKTQAGSGRAIPLVQPAWAALDMWAARFPNRKPEQFIFPACENGRIDPEKPICNWRTAWHSACEEAKLDGLGFHSLRHSAATKLLETGTPFAVVAQILGWAPSTAVRMAKRYGHIRPEVQRAALEKISTDRPAATLEAEQTVEFPEAGHKTGHTRESVVKSDVRM